MRTRARVPWILLEVASTGTQAYARTVGGHDQQADPVAGADVVLSERGSCADGEVEAARRTVDTAGDADVTQPVDDQPHAGVLLGPRGDDVQLPVRRDTGQVIRLRRSPLAKCLMPSNSVPLPIRRDRCRPTSPVG